MHACHETHFLPLVVSAGFIGSSLCENRTTNPLTYGACGKVRAGGVKAIKLEEGYANAIEAVKCLARGWEWLGVAVVLLMVMVGRKPSCVPRVKLAIC